MIVAGTAWASTYAVADAANAAVRINRRTIGTSSSCSITYLYLKNYARGEPIGVRPRSKLYLCERRWYPEDVPIYEYECRMCGSRHARFRRDSADRQRRPAFEPCEPGPVCPIPPE